MRRALPAIGKGFFYVMTYAEKLEDPRWRAKRDIIIERDGHSCMLCKNRASNTILQVHHIKYTGEPWEAPDEDLITLCFNCHKMIEIGKVYGFKPSFQEIVNKNNMPDYISCLEIRLARALNTIKFQEEKMRHILSIERQYASELEIKISEIENNNDYN